MNIGVLSYQGDFQRHVDVLDGLGAVSRAVRSPEHLVGLDGLVIPGGESTTIGKLMDRFGLLSAIRDAISSGLAVMGTCAGAILLARSIENSDQVRIGGLDITVRRNAYGRQIDSFEADLQIPIIGRKPFTGVFIRAPLITAVRSGIEILGEFEESPVLVRSKRLLALTFHPELTQDARVHRYFLEEVVRSGV